jgi:opacity protein-like surface antigen
MKRTASLTAALRTVLHGMLAPLAVLALAAPAQAQAVYGPVDDEAKTGWEGEVSVSATYAKRDRDLISDFDRTGLGAQAVVGYRLPAGSGTNVRVEAEAEVDKFTASYGGTVELTQQLGKAVTVSLAASGYKDRVTLESFDTDQAAVRAGVEIAAGSTTIEGFARHRWRHYDDLAAGTGKGWQFGSRLRERFGSYHWAEARLSHERIGDNGGRHGYRRISLGLDYSQPLTKRLRLRPGFDFRQWTYQGRTIADLATNPRRKDRLIRPELGLAWGKTKGLFARGSAAWDFYHSNDPRFTGNGPRLQLVAGYRF